MATLDKKISIFINKARTKNRALAKELIGEFDPNGYQSNRSKELLEMLYESRKFIDLLYTTDRGGLSDKQTDSLIDFFWKWLQLNKVNQINYLSYSMPIDNSTVQVASNVYALASDLTEEISDRVEADIALNVRIDGIQDQITNLQPIFPATFFDNYVSSYKAVFDDDARLHTHSNKALLDQIDNGKMANINALAAHYASIGEPSGVHVSSADRLNWNSKVSSAQLAALSSVYAPISHTHTISQITGLQTTINQINADIINMAGEDGREIQLNRNGDNLEWRYVGDASYVSLGSIKGDPGVAGAPFTVDVRGLSNDRFNSVYDTENASFTYLETDTGYLYYRYPSGGDATVPGGWSAGIKFLGDNGWSPVFGVTVVSASRYVFELMDWVGGNGLKPVLNAGNVQNPRWYLGQNGFTLEADLAVNIKGPIGNGHGPIIGAVGDLATRDSYDDRPLGFIYMRNDVAPQTIFIKNSDVDADWSVELPWQGPGGGGSGSATFDPQNANLFFAGPVSGSAAAPSFRSISITDLPNLSSQYVSIAGGVMTGALTLSGAPVNSLHAATKAYVDSLISGISWKNPVTVATTGNVTLSGEQTIDGILTSTSSVLVWQQSDPTQNGVYITAAGAWSRRTDIDTGSELVNSAVLVLSGTLYQNAQFVCITPSPITLGSTNVIFVQFAGPVSYSAGTGLSLGGNVFSVATNGITNTLIRQSAGLSVIGRSANTTGNVADIVGTNGQVLRVSGTVLEFGTIATAGIGNSQVTYAKIQNVTDGRLLGNASGSAAAPAEITVGTGLTLLSNSLTAGGLVNGDIEFKPNGPGYKFIITEPDFFDTFDYLAEFNVAAEVISISGQTSLTLNSSAIKFNSILANSILYANSSGEIKSFPTATGFSGLTFSVPGNAIDPFLILGGLIGNTTFTSNGDDFRLKGVFFSIENNGASTATFFAGSPTTGKIEQAYIDTTQQTVFRAGNNSTGEAILDLQKGDSPATAGTILKSANGDGSLRAGQRLTISAGNATSSGSNNDNGGSIFFSTGTKIGSALDGNFFFNTQAGGNVSWFKTTADFGAGTKVMYIGAAGVNPTTNPTGGGLLFVDSTDSYKIKWRVPGGTVYDLTGSAGSAFNEGLFSASGVVKLGEPAGTPTSAITSSRFVYIDSTGGDNGLNFGYSHDSTFSGISLTKVTSGTAKKVVAIKTFTFGGGGTEYSLSFDPDNSGIGSVAGVYLKAGNTGIMDLIGGSSWAVYNANSLVKKSAVESYVLATAKTYTARQTFDDLSIARTGDIASPTNGNIWYNSTSNILYARINGSTVNLGVGGGGISGSGASGRMAYWSGASSLTSDANFRFSSDSLYVGSSYVYGESATGSGDFTYSISPGGVGTGTSSFVMYAKGASANARIGFSNTSRDHDLSLYYPGANDLVFLHSAPAVSASRTFQLLGANGNASYSHGHYVEIHGGNAYTSANGNGGWVKIIAGNSNGTSTIGGTVQIQASNGGSVTGIGGDVQIQAGTGGLSNGLIYLTGDSVRLGRIGASSASIGMASADSVSLDGAKMFLIGSAAYATSGNGNGGDIMLFPGAKRSAGSGHDGGIAFFPPSGGSVNWQSGGYVGFWGNRTAAPTGNPVDGCFIYGEDVGAKSEMFVRTEAGATVNVSGLLTPVICSGTTLTLDESYRGKFVYCTNASGTTVTVPAGLQLGFNVILWQDTNTGTITVTTSGGATVNGKTGSLGQNDTIMLVHYKATNVYAGK